MRKIKLSRYGRVAEGVYTRGVGEVSCSEALTYISWDSKGTVIQRSHWGCIARNIDHFSLGAAGQSLGTEKSLTPSSGQEPPLFTPVCCKNINIFCVLHDMKSLGKHYSGGRENPSRRKARETKNGVHGNWRRRVHERESEGEWVILWILVALICEGNGSPLQHSCLENHMDRGAWWAAVHEVAQSRTRLTDFTFTFHFHALEEEMATHPSVLAWTIPGTGEPGGLPSMGSHRVGHDWSDSVAAAAAALIWL